LNYYYKDCNLLLILPYLSGDVGGRIPKGAQLPTAALDARGAHGGSRRGSESVSI